MIKPNDIVYIKTTNEPVYVLAVAEEDAEVRRPIQTMMNGIVHKVESWPLAELETQAESEARMAATDARLYKQRQNLMYETAAPISEQVKN